MNRYPEEDICYSHIIDETMLIMNSIFVDIISALRVNNQ